MNCNQSKQLSINKSFEFVKLEIKNYMIKGLRLLR